MTEWFTPQQGNMIGAIAGAVFGGIGGGVTGPLIGVLAPRGRAKLLVLGLMLFWIALGVGLLGAAGYALIDGQPRHVWFPFALVGLVTTAVMGGLFPVARQRYRQAELRRLEAEELRRG